MGVVIVVQRQSQLLEVVATLGPAGGLPRLLHGGEQQRHEHTENRDHDQ